MRSHVLMHIQAGVALTAATCRAGSGSEDSYFRGSDAERCIEDVADDQ
jgi:hypothetical protein